MKVSKWMVICAKNNEIYAPKARDNYSDAYKQMSSSYVSTLNIIDCEYAAIVEDGAIIKAGKDTVTWKIIEVEFELDTHAFSEVEEGKRFIHDGIIYLKLKSENNLSNANAVSESGELKKFDDADEITMI